MNWNDPEVRVSLKELEETLFLRGRDSRLVRAAFLWSRGKKQFITRTKQTILCLKNREKKEPSTLRVLFWLVGGMGDATGSKRLVSAYRKLLPNAVFEIYAPLPGVAQMLFGTDKNTRVLDQAEHCWKNYDLVIQCCLTAKFLYADEKRLQRLASGFWPVFERAQQAQESLGTLLDDPFLTEPALGRWLFSKGGRRFDLLSYTGGTDLPYDVQERLSVTRQAVEKFGLSDVRYITFHDGTSHAQAKGSGRPTRSWPAAHWREWLRLMKLHFPDIKLVQLGGQNSPVYQEADVCLVNKTAVSELPDLLAGAVLHVDTESGLVLLAQYLDVKSVVLFGPSSQQFFGFAKNKNLSAGSCNGCMWVTTDWMMRCPVGHSTSICMENVTPQAVLDGVKETLAR